MSIEELRVDKEGVIYKGDKEAVIYNNTNGYRRMSYKKKKYYAHQVVAHHHHGERPSPLHMVNHKDGNKHNNHPSNLEWVTARGNFHHALDTGLSTKPVQPKPIVSDNGGGIGYCYPSITSAACHVKRTAANICWALGSSNRTSANSQWRYI